MGTLSIYNQQVAAEIYYQVAPREAHRVVRASPLFNALGFTGGGKLLRKRQWFALDQDAKVADAACGLVHDRAEVLDAMRALNGTDWHDIIDRKPVYDVSPQALEKIFAGAAGEIHLRIGAKDPQDLIADMISERVPFLRLSGLLTRLSQSLKHEDRGALLRVDIRHCPLNHFVI